MNGFADRIVVTLNSDGSITVLDVGGIRLIYIKQKNSYSQTYVGVGSGGKFDSSYKTSEVCMELELW